MNCIMDVIYRMLSVRPARSQRLLVASVSLELRLLDSFEHKTFLCAVQSSAKCNKILFACLANAGRKRARLRAPWLSGVERRAHSDDPLAPQDRTEKKEAIEWNERQLQNEFGIKFCALLN